ncbi:hypothetical protein [Chryseobacterium indologenes]|uniref:hypothetical protein n=1 Tax=Chryseobacterium indologenes TaxID=253 RepID=UPI00301ABDFD
MDTNKLFIFSKDTDAVSAQRGYNYQTLKTLESWVENFKNSIREEIYCEFEEDIFHKNTETKGAKFRQIKLYSSNFSFNSKEIKKAIFNFFTLHVKSNYNDFTKQFIFETNTNIAEKYKDNDAELLKEWVKFQKDLDEEKTSKYARKSKEIVNEFINEKKINDKNRFDIAEAKEIFLKLDDVFWQNFIRLIRWDFLGRESGEEFSNIKERIESLIIQLPFSIKNDNVSQVFGVLLETVFCKINIENEEDRKLTYDEFETIMLNIGSEEDKWYAKRFENYKKIGVPDFFRIGEFYEVINLINYCRRKIYLNEHKDVWNSYLIFYTRNKTIHNHFRRKAIYELVFLNYKFYELDYDNLADRVAPDGDLKGFEDDVRFYFANFEELTTSEDFENANVILNLLLMIAGQNKIDISSSEIKIWYRKLYIRIGKEIENSKNINVLCHLYEIKGTFILNIDRIKRNKNTTFILWYEKILDIADDALLYKLSQFGDRIDKFIKIQIAVDPTDHLGFIRILEDFSDKLFPLLEKREGRIKLAEQQIQRGYNYLQTKEPFNLLKALEYFHKAKENYHQEDTIEGYVLALLNLSQLYNAIGMLFAAKYYALGAYRVSLNHELVKRVETALELLFHYDYKQGSWFNSFIVFGRLMNLRLDSNFDPVETDEEGEYLGNFTFAFLFMRRNSSQFSYFMDSYMTYLDGLGRKIAYPIASDIIKPGLEMLNSELKSSKDLDDIIEKTLIDFPLNDIGRKRNLNFYALGSHWQITFENNYEILSVAEEYIANIQIVLSEISLSQVDFHLIKSNIIINLVLSDKFTEPQQKLSNDVIEWTLNVVYTNDNDIDKINSHSAHNMSSLLYVLANISLLKSEEFVVLFTEFFNKFSLDNKQQSVNLYQKIHRDIYTKKDFDSLLANSFQKEIFSMSFPLENKIMIWNNSLSSKYNLNHSVNAIKNRFDNAHLNIHITLKKLLKDLEFHILVKDVRDKGWKDWQIIGALVNFMINYKIQFFEAQPQSTDKEVAKKMKELFKKYHQMDEKDCYVDFPVSILRSNLFLEQFNITLLSCLETYGLRSNLISPNFKGIKEFMDIRFNFAIDEYNENNPLKDIK